MGFAIHIQTFYDIEGILHKEKSMTDKDLSVRKKMKKSPLVQRMM